MLEEEILDKAVSYIINDSPKILKTGFIDLDEILSNVEYGSLITIASTPSMGKTSFIISVLYNLLRNKEKCLLFTIEDSKLMFIRRMLLQIAEISVSACFLNKLTEDNIAKINTVKDELKHYDLTAVDNVIDIEEIEEKINKQRPRFVFIDSLDYLYGFSSNVLKRLKMIAEYNECIIFNTCELPNYEIEQREDKRPLLFDLRKLGKADIISDVVLFIYRECYYNKDDYVNPNSAEIIAAKNSFGAFGSVSLSFKPEFRKFYSLPQIDTF